MNNREFYKNRVNYSLLNLEEIAELARSIKSWDCVDAKYLKKRYDFSSYKQGLDFVDRAAMYAEEVNHHPNLLLGYKYVEAEIWTHNVNGLSQADFALAQDLDRLNNIDILE